MAGEHRVLIGNNGIGEPMDWIDMLHEKESDASSGVRVSKWQKMSKFCHPVDQNPNAIVLTRLGQTIDDDEVHCYHIP